jgi:predicted NUDIX family NTP pyrophosphohydrolase
MKKSAGLLMYRRDSSGELQVLLAHPGGPFWVRKDEGAWSLPKGEYADDEEPLAAAQREFAEETGFEASPPFIALGQVKLKSGKLVSGWAFAGDCRPERLKSNCVEIEWPPRSGRRQQVPEIDRVQWFSLAQARLKILPAQVPLLDRLEAQLAPAA